MISALSLTEVRMVEPRNSGQADKRQYWRNPPTPATRPVNDKAGQKEADEQWNQFIRL